MPGPSRRPLVCLLVVGGIVGVVLAIWVPSLTNLDEARAFARVWGISDWDVIPDRTPPPRASEGARVCLPADVAAVVFEAHGATRPRPGGGTCGGGTVAVNVGPDASVPPVAFVGPATGVAVARFLGLDVDAQVLLARLASLAVYLALCALGVRWAPRGRWALVAVALLPASLYGAVTSLSSVGFTIAASIMVVGSALRLTDPALRIGTRRRLLEASAACAAMAAAAPPYVVVVAAYLVVWGGRAARPERPPRWPVLVPAAVAVVVAALWHFSLRGLQSCEVLVGGALDAGGSAESIARAPWRVVTAATDAAARDGDAWVREAVLVDVVPWPWWIAATVAVGFVLVALTPDRVEESRRSELTAAQRIVLVLTGLGAGLAAVAWWLISCGPAGLVVEPPFGVTQLIPALPPLLAGLSLPGRGRYRPRIAWILLLTAGFYAVWLAALLDTVR